MKLHRKVQAGVSLIEVLIAVLILSFGMLSLGAMMAYAIQMPKLAGYRSTATSQANAYIERIRANKQGFLGGFYSSTGTEPISYNKQTPQVFTAAPCIYPNCTVQQIADFDTREMLQTLRRELSTLSGIRVICSGTCQTLEADLWVIWDEPSQLSGLNLNASDECPSAVIAPTFTAFTSPLPRCLHMRFKL